MGSAVRLRTESASRFGSRAKPELAKRTGGRGCGPESTVGPRLPADQRYASIYLFGAICLARGKGAARALPLANTEAIQLHLDEISHHIARGAHGVLLLDRAGFHTTALAGTQSG